MIIKTDALFRQIIRAQGAEVRYLFQILDDAYLPQPETRRYPPKTTTIRALREDMRQTQARSEFVQRNTLGRFLQMAVPSIRTAPDGPYVVRILRKGRYKSERSTRYDFPPLSQTRRELELYIGQTIPWSNKKTEWQGNQEEEPPFPIHVV